jgi:PIN domain nuclease of toxin-antitoxin system
VAILLDTHVFLWWILGSQRLGKRAEAAIENSDNIVYVSVVSIWEVAIKGMLGRFVMPADVFAREIEGSAFSELTILSAHALAAGLLPMHHRDPFDRMLVAQARTEGLTLVSHDKALEAYDVPILWT